MSYAGAGLILITPDFRVLLVQDAKTHKWGFPKGHREEIDMDDLQTAIREVKEETGITPDQYTVHEPAFRITKGSSSYLFRYAVLHAMTGKIQNRYEICQIQYVSIVDLMREPDQLDGNKYLRTWIANIRSFSSRKEVQQFSQIVLSLSSPPSNSEPIGVF